VRPKQPSAKLPAGRPRKPRSFRSWSRDLQSGTAFAALFALGLFSATPTAQAQVLPTGGTVTHGNAAISGSGSGLLIDQSSGSAIISWDGFSIGAGGTTHFNNGAGMTLNRVGGNVPSRIDGTLTATGGVFLVNPAGVTVGTGGMVATGGSFAASTHDVTDADFLDGGDTVFAGDSKAEIVNHGTISSAMGDVALIARRVENSGDISAPNGTAALLAGYDILMRETTGPNGKFLVRAGGADTEVVNSGTIRAAEVELRANGGNVLALAGNTRGVIKATGVAKRGGRIFLTAGGGKVQAGGRVIARRQVSSASTTRQEGGEVFINADAVLASAHIDVSGLGAKGGNVDIGGRNVALQGATVNASGDLAGGRIRVGGAFQGGDFGDLQTADTTSVDANALLTASAVESGDGGEVIVWANGTTSFDGAIVATGARNGGFAEVSGKIGLGYTGLANLGGGTGGNGTLLLDPTDFTIGAAEALAITTALATSHVVVSTSAAGGGNGDIFVNANVMYGSANDLALLAHRNIDANASIQNAGSGDLTLVAGWDGTTEAPGGSGITPSSAAVDTGNLVATANSFGNGGDILLGDGTQGNLIAVGSQSGTTTALTRDLKLTGGNAGLPVAQLGYRFDGTGDIEVMTTRDVTLQTGTGGGAPPAVQIGHGGSGDLAGDIRLLIAGDLTLSTVGGVLGTSAHIGHGNASAASFGTRTGDISAIVAGTTTFSQTPAAEAWIGHRSSTAGALSNADVALVTNGLSVTGDDFADMLRSNLLGGNVLIANTAPATTPDAGGFANLGTDDILFAGWNGGAFTSDFDLTLAARGDVVMLSNVRNEGTGKVNLLGGWNGTTGLDLSGFPTLDMAAVETAGAFGAAGGNVYIGDGSQTQDIQVGSRLGDIHVLAHDLRVRGSDVDFGSGARLGFRAGSTNGIDGDIRIVAMDDVLVEGGLADFTSATIGHDGVESSDTTFGGITIIAETANANVVAVSAGDGRGSYAQIGHEGCCGPADADISILGEQVSVEGGPADFANAQIGHSSDSSSGDIDITASGALAITGGDADFSSAKVGHFGDAVTGNIDVAAGGPVTLIGGLVDSAFAQIGHGDPAGLFSQGTRQGDITVVAAGEMTLDDGPGNSLAWIGHGTGTAGGVSNADIFLQAFGFDRDFASMVAAGGLGLFNKDMLEADIGSGDFTMIATGTGMLLEDPLYNSPHQLMIAVANDLVMNTNATYTNLGTGNIVFAAGGDFHNDTGSLTPIQTGGRWLVYSTRPDNNRNDIEITNWNFLRYATPFDVNNPYVGVGNGLVYSVAPVVNFIVSDETISYGGVITPTIAQVLTVNGVAVDPIAYGLGINPATALFALAASVILDAGGNPIVGFHPGGLTTASEFLPYFGMSFTTTPGDLTVTSNGPVVPPLTPIVVTGNPIQTAVRSGIGEMCAFRSDDEDPKEGGPSYDRIIELCGIVESDTP